MPTTRQKRNTRKNRPTTPPADQPVAKRTRKRTTDEEQDEPARLEAGGDDGNKTQQITPAKRPKITPQRTPVKTPKGTPKRTPEKRKRKSNEVAMEINTRTEDQEHLARKSTPEDEEDFQLVLLSSEHGEEIEKCISSNNTAQFKKNFLKFIIDCLETIESVKYKKRETMDASIRSDSVNGTIVQTTFGSYEAAEKICLKVDDIIGYGIYFVDGSYLAMIEMIDLTKAFALVRYGLNTGKSKIQFKFPNSGNVNLSREMRNTILITGCPPTWTVAMVKYSCRFFGWCGMPLRINNEFHVTFNDGKCADKAADFFHLLKICGTILFIEKI